MPNVDPFRPTLRLFMSVDIVGSTAFKQAARGSLPVSSQEMRVPSEGWFSPLAQFYRHIEATFRSEWLRYIEYVGSHKDDAYNWPVGQAPTLWKGVGDELIYTKVITDHREAMGCLHCWVQAVKRYKMILREKYPSLDLKAAAWIAGFPVNNSEIIIRTEFDSASDLQAEDDPVYDNAQLLLAYYSEDRPNGLIQDFVGPGIDTGFRVSSLATPRKLTLTLDLALLIAKADQDKQHGFDCGNFIYGYDGRVQLKGVFGGVPYPVFWLDLLSDNQLAKVEDDLTPNRTVGAGKIIAFAEEFISAHPQFIDRPYMESSTEAFFSKRPARHIERLEAFRTFLESERKRLEAEREAVDPLNEKGEELSEGEIKKFVTEDIKVPTTP